MRRQIWHFWQWTRRLSAIKPPRAALDGPRRAVEGEVDEGHRVFGVLAPKATPKSWRRRQRRIGLGGRGPALRSTADDFVVEVDCRPLVVTEAAGAQRSSGQPPQAALRKVHGDEVDSVVYSPLQLGRPCLGAAREIAGRRYALTVLVV